MAKPVDKISSLIAPKYFNWIREAILKHGKINIRGLSRTLGILDGNTYFRNFIEDKRQDYLGISGLTSVLDKCGYDLKIVPVKRNDFVSRNTIEEMNNDAFKDIVQMISDLAESVKRAPKVEKVKKDTTIKNSNVINDGIMGIDNPDILKGLFDDNEDTYDDEDNLAVGTSSGIFDMSDFKINLNDID